MPDPLLATHLFRVVQEAVHNAIQHSKATRIQVMLRSRDRHFTVSIVDDGQGFDATKDANSGMGLQIMRHRMSLMGGRIIVASQPSRGTSIRCTVTIAE